MLRFRYSLREFLLAATVVCLGISHWHVSRRLTVAERELRQVRSEVGYLSIEDKTKVHAIAVDSGEPNTWRWRMFVPKGTHYSWNIACENLPLNSVPSDGVLRSISNEPYWERDSEVVVTARLRELVDGSWSLSVDSKIGDSKHQMGGAMLKIPREKVEWMWTAATCVDIFVLGSRGTAACDPNGPIVLLKRRRCEQQPDGSYRPSSDSAPGFAVWLSKSP